MRHRSPVEEGCARRLAPRVPAGRSSTPGGPPCPSHSHRLSLLHSSQGDLADGTSSRREGPGSGRSPHRTSASSTRRPHHRCPVPGPPPARGRRAWPRDPGCSFSHVAQRGSRAQGGMISWSRGTQPVDHRLGRARRHGNRRISTPPALDFYRVHPSPRDGRGEERVPTPVVGMDGRTFDSTRPSPTSATGDHVGVRTP